MKNDTISFHFLSFLCTIAFLITLFPAGVKSPLAAENTVLRAGTAKIDITPETPIPMSGYGNRKDPFKEVHDRLFSRVVVFSDGERTAAVITADVIGFSHAFWEDVTERIGQATGIQREYIMLAPAHNHDGPVMAVYNRDPGSDVETYVEDVKKKLVDTTKKACDSLKPVRIGVGKGECRMNINRRAILPDGSITLGRNPYGPCDHTVGVLEIFDSNGGSPVAVMYNWPCHGTTLGPTNYDISGDWPGAASRYIEAALGDRVISPVTIGASGDINPIYGPHPDYDSFAVDAIGRDLGEKVLAVMKDITPLDAGTIRASQRMIELPRKTDKSNLQQPELGAEPVLDVRLTVLRIGPAVFAGVSGELFNEIGAAVKEKSPFSNTFIVTHCNGSSGYLITDKAHEEGGYEARSTRAKPGAEKTITENLLAMIDDVTD